MKLSSRVIIAPEKLKDYLLSPRKRNDKSKWLAKAGYQVENWQILEKDLRTQILSLDAVLTEKTKFGKIYEINGMLTGPNGKTLSVRSIWMNEHESKLIKFITMFPDKK